MLSLMPPFLRVPLDKELRMALKQAAEGACRDEASQVKYILRIALRLADSPGKPDEPNTKKAGATKPAAKRVCHPVSGYCLLRKLHYLYAQCTLCPLQSPGEVPE